MSLLSSLVNRKPGDIFFAPSLLAADLSQVAREVARVEEAGVDMLHVDVMDGHFVPNLSFGVPFVSMLKKITNVPLDVHLMIDNVTDTLDWYLDAGADFITVHAEACGDIPGTLARIKEAGAGACVSINPETPVARLAGSLGQLDMVLLMSVHPGFGGQSYIHEVTEKVRDVARRCEKLEHPPLIQIDGGITPETIGEAYRAGARCFVAGSAVYKAKDPARALADMRAAAKATA